MCGSITNIIPYIVWNYVKKHIYNNKKFKLKSAVMNNIVVVLLHFHCMNKVNFVINKKQQTFTELCVEGIVIL